MSDTLKELRAVYSDAGIRCLRDIEALGGGTIDEGDVRFRQYHQYGTELAVINRVIEAIDVRLGTVDPPKPPT